ncbi:hypothetical protein SNOG_04784 [Parastagonospora nodorum SN15]|uniref:Uncharacterized protein n=1 Tax=Phaeosphaeria nodorum (strain SN15 / ATCC MYA-4574 / FGSC 10173) TaxID=321614 RepID=Q0UTY0_PHANO|nr:hypothetical protein SNOG_04784 [Parastagonospora nodorum SN15]EAT87175.1 hypothetical protein SNOG_04784 [Parastagonospora nodorum SN15]
MSDIQMVLSIILPVPLKSQQVAYERVLVHAPATSDYKFTDHSGS